MKRSIVNEPREFRSFDEFAEWFDAQLSAFGSGVPELPVFYAKCGLCPKCGQPVPPNGPDAPIGMTGAQLAKAGRTGCLCKCCGFPVRRWKQRRDDGPACKHCGALVPEADDNITVVECAPCVSWRSDLHAAGLLKKPKRKLKCSDCNTLLPPNRRRPGRCEKCRDKRRRESYRNSKRKAGQHSTVKGARTRINSGSNDPENRPAGPRPTSPISGS